MLVFRWLFGLGLAIGVAAVFVTFSAHRSGTPPEQAAPLPEAVEAREADDRGEGIASNLNPPKLDLETSVKPLIIVDSLPLADQSALTDWRGIEGAAGHFDQLVLVDGSKPGPGGVSAIDVLVAQGWAGDTGLGMRLADMLLARCDRVVARAKVTLDRPDVAAAVHPNLVRSGWEAQILAGHLPSCGG
jgi:hypothetical protein